MLTNEERARADREHFDKYEVISKALGVEHLALIVSQIAPRERIVEALKTDRALNNIALRLWDAQHPRVYSLAQTAGMRGWSLGDTVCTLKHIARHHIVGEPPPGESIAYTPDTCPFRFSHRARPQPCPLCRA